MLGEAVSFYLTTEPTCPAKEDKAQLPYYQVVTVSAGGVIVGPGILQLENTTTTRFYIKNGWDILSDIFGTDTRTNIQLAKPAAIGGGCLHMGKDILEVSPCKEIFEQKFHVLIYLEQS
jgi:hypothetical protein